MDLTHTRHAHRPPARTTPIGLALQGGGSWGAYTWGVLDELLAHPGCLVTQLSGTSAGAINAAIVAGALAHGSRELAREKLDSFWRRIAEPPSADVMRSLLGSIAPYWRWTVDAWLLAGEMLNMPNANVFGINPLRDAVAGHVDIEAIRSERAPALFVTATHVRTGRPRVISNDAMSIDALLASACLPQLFPTVELDGEPYWDGGYAGNPSLWPMLRSGLSSDLLLVQLVPDRVDDVALESPDIRRRVGEIVFNASLVAEMNALQLMREVGALEHGRAAVTDVRMHRVGPPAAHLFVEGGAGDRGPAWLQQLHDEGARAAREFLSLHAGDIGVRETLDVGRVFCDLS